jgi:glycine oxidase
MTHGRTIWTDQLEPWERSALDPGLPDRLDPAPDVLVVGGGMLGVATALACQAAGAGSVLLIEAHRLAHGASGGAAGLLTPEPHQGSDPAPLAELGRDSLVRWRALQDSIPGGVGLTDIDWLAPAPHPPGFLADPSPAVEWLDAAQFHELIPALDPAPTGVIVRRQARVNPVRALARLAARLPQVATACPATAVRTSHGRVTAVATPAGDITPGAVVFATGLPPDLDGLELRLPASTVKGHLLVTEPVPLRLPGTVAQLGTQLEDGSLLSGGTLDTTDTSPEVNEAVIGRIRRDLAATVPALAGVRVTHRWCCWRPRHPDGLAVIDRVPGLANAWLTSGHYRTGILMAPAAGAALAQWIATGQPATTLRPWQIQDRFIAER